MPQSTIEDIKKDHKFFKHKFWLTLKKSPKIDTCSQHMYISGESLPY